MKALVLVAHGSRRATSNQEVVELCKTVAQELKHEFALVQAGFLEFAQPAIPEAIDICIQQGALEVSILPYFLSAGNHVYQDVPAEVEKAKQKHVGIPMVITMHAGAMPQMKDLVLAAVSSRDQSNQG